MNSNMLNVLVGLLLPAIFIGLGGTGGGATLVAAWYIGLTVFSLAMAYLGRGLGRGQGFAIVAGYLAFLVVAVSSVRRRSGSGPAKMPLKPGRRQSVRQRGDTHSGQECGVTGAPSTRSDRTERQRRA